MKAFAVILSLVPALTLSAPAMSNEHGAHKDREATCASKAKRYNRADMMPRYLRSIELTEVQNTRIRELMQQHREQSREQMQQKREQWHAYRQLGFEDSLDQARLDQLLENSAEDFKQQARQRVELNHAIFQTLTAEQQSTVMQKMAEYRDKSRERKQRQQ